MKPTDRMTDLFLLLHSYKSHVFVQEFPKHTHTQLLHSALIEAVMVSGEEKNIIALTLSLFVEATTFSWFFQLLFKYIINIFSTHLVPPTWRLSLCLHKVWSNLDNKTLFVCASVAERQRSTLSDFVLLQVLLLFLLQVLLLFRLQFPSVPSLLFFFSPSLLSLRLYLHPFLHRFDSASLSPLFCWSFCRKCCHVVKVEQQQQQPCVESRDGILIA